MIVLGLTGSGRHGKSTVAGMIRARGVACERCRRGWCTGSMPAPRRADRSGLSRHGHGQCRRTGWRSAAWCSATRCGDEAARGDRPSAGRAGPRSTFSRPPAWPAPRRRARHSAFCSRIRAEARVDAIATSPRRQRCSASGCCAVPALTEERLAAVLARQVRTREAATQPFRDRHQRSARGDPAAGRGAVRTLAGMQGKKAPRRLAGRRHGADKVPIGSVISTKRGRADARDRVRYGNDGAQCPRRRPLGRTRRPSSSSTASRPAAPITSTSIPRRHAGRGLRGARAVGRVPRR